MKTGSGWLYQILTNACEKLDNAIDSARDIDDRGAVARYTPARRNLGEATAHIAVKTMCLENAIAKAYNAIDLDNDPGAAKEHLERAERLLHEMLHGEGGNV